MEFVPWKKKLSSQENTKAIWKYLVLIGSPHNLDKYMQTLQMVHPYILRSKAEHRIKLTYSKIEKEEEKR